MGRSPSVVRNRVDSEIWPLRAGSGWSDWYSWIGMMLTGNRPPPRTFVSAVSRRTSLLLVGQDGWPLKKDGSLADKLATAQVLQTAGCPIEILSEEQLLGRLELEGAAGGVQKRFKLAQLGRLLKLPGGR